MPSKNMLPKGKRRQSVRADYKVARDARETAESETLSHTIAEIYGEATPAKDKPAQAAVPDEDDELLPPAPTAVGASARREWTVDADARGQRVDSYLATAVPDISRARAQLLIEHGQVRVNGIIAKSKQKLNGSESIIVDGNPQPTPLRATPEDIPLTIVYEDKHIAVIDKPAGMMVHAGSGLNDDARSGGTLVNALLHHFKDQLSELGGPLRPGIVHRLDKLTSGLILIAKHDRAHRALAEMFSERSLEKRYIALVHRSVERNAGVIDLPIARDRVRRTRMTTRVSNSYLTTASHGAPSLRHPNEPDPADPRTFYKNTARRDNIPRPARTLYTVIERISTPAGDFTLLDIKIETGRTHQIRVHMQSLGHPVVGDTLYGAPARIAGLPATISGPTLPRNFLHAARLKLTHPITGKALDLEAPLPEELTALLTQLRTLPPADKPAAKPSKH